MKKPLSLYTCCICKFDFPFEKVKYSADGKRLVCVSCHEKLSKKSQEDAQSERFIGTSNRRFPRPESIEVICTNCSYKFYYRKPLKPICPYCGNTSLKQYQDLTAQNLINDSEGMK